MTGEPCFFGELLRRYRVAAGLTQQVLAEKAGLSVRGLSDLERGLRLSPHPDTVHRLAEALMLDRQDRSAFARSVVFADLVHSELADAVPSSILTRRPPRHRRVNVDSEARVRAVALPTLTLPTTSFVGRQREVAEVQRLLLTTRLLSVVGPGGVGKTRLALEVARLNAGEYADGVFDVDLAPLSQSELVIPTTAQVLGLRTEVDRQPLQHLVAFLSARHLMLVIDNCEHVIDCCAELARALMLHCPNIRVLTTSREPLAVEGETVWRLEPLENVAATQLFIERARAQRADFDSADAATLKRLCQALDNLPLALELAAARVTLLTPAEILARLHERFELLKSVGRGTIPRQQTLRATVEWSVALLEPREQQLFSRLSVFAGPFDLAGANAMGGADTLDVLGRLVDKSLVVAQATQQGTRYRLLDTLRGYASQRLHEAGEVELARRRHLDHFLARAESLYSPTETIDAPTRVLDDDLDNLRGALQWCLVADARAGLRLIGSTRTVWFRRDFAEGRRWAHLFLERCPEPSVARALALLTAGHLESLADTERSSQLLVEARDLAADLGDRRTYVMADALLGTVAFLEERTADAVRQLEGSLTISEELGDARMSALGLVVLAMALLTDRTRREEALGALERAQRLGAEVGDRWIAGMVDYVIGLYWRWTGHPQQALDHFRRAATRLHAIGEVANLYIPLLQIARLLAGRDPVRAARLAGASLAIGAHLGVPPGHRLRQAADQLHADLGARVGIEPAHRAWSQGERLSADEALTLALEDGQGVSMGHGGLSARELVVAGLVARGLTNAQVADLLQLSRRTVENHLARIFNKLGLSTRTQLATWIVANENVSNPLLSDTLSNFTDVHGPT